MRLFHRLGLCATAVSLGLLASCQAVDNLLIGAGGLDKGDYQAGTLSFPALTSMPYSARHPQYLQRWNGQAWESIYLKGINLGTGLPGQQAGDLAATREQYASWFARMREMGFNVLRTYTLHPPRFYEEFARYNAAHPDKPLYLMHGIWLDEDEEALDLYDHTAVFDQNILEAVNAVHGKQEIPPRFGLAYGKYTANISRWVIGWIVGREIHPAEVDETVRKHGNQTRWDGQVFGLSGTPVEVWAAQRLEKVIRYERETYGVERPISFSSWPTLDPLEHPSENPEQSQEDDVSVDMAQLELRNAPAGYFASFHAYPYYPNFLNDDPTYRQARDEQGINNYVGYLRDLKAHYKDMPVVIAEYGVPSSWGNAHFSVSGMHHGGHDELAQGRYNARLTHNLKDTGMAGGMIFAWIDEWWKRTWIVDELAMPRDRYKLWHNLTSPEQNFGLIALEVDPAPFQTVQQGTGRIQKIETGADAQFFRVRLQLNSPLTDQEQLTLGFDTFSDSLGDRLLPNGVRTTQRSELALTVQQRSQARLLVTQPYDLFGIWHRTAGPEQLFRPLASEGLPWAPVRWQNNSARSSPDGSLNYPLEIDPIGELQLRAEGQTASSRDAVILNGSSVEIRLPWTLLQFTDPSTRSVLNDDRLTPQRETTVSEGIAVAVSLGDTLLEAPRTSWATWNSAPRYREREKDGVGPLVAALAQISERP
ncbi:MAG: hypothetical protein ACO1RX_16755 [Candidatus Sericytochromatia bacterium]